MFCFVLYKMDSKCLIFIGLIVAFIPLLLARKHDEAVAQNEKQDSCGDWTYGPCVLKKKAATCGRGKKLATTDDENCPKKQKKVRCRIPCEDQTQDLEAQNIDECKYKKPQKVKHRDISCDSVTNRHEITLTLVKGDPSVCPPTKVISKECRKRQARAADTKERRKTGERKQKQAASTAVAVSTATPNDDAECKYHKVKSPKASCDPVTNTRTVVKQLKKNSPDTCEPTKTVTQSCHTKKAKVKKGGRKHAGHKATEHSTEMD